MISRVPRAVGKQPPTNQLGWSFMDWFSDYEKPAPLARTPAVDNFWNAGVNMAYGRQSAYPVDAEAAQWRKRQAKRTRGDWSLWGPPQAVGVEAYNRAKVYADYGNMAGAKAELGDLFNDVMGAIVPGWDARPAALKNIVVKPDPSKIVEMAQKAAPNAAQDIVRAANANGMQVYVNTPAGQVNVTPENAQLYYGNYAFLTKAQNAFGMVSELSPMVWVGIAAAGLGLFLMMKR